LISIHIGGTRKQELTSYGKAEFVKYSLK